MRPSDGAWGMETLNGTWNGMIGQLLRNVRFVEYSIAPFFC